MLQSFQAEVQVDVNLTLSLCGHFVAVDGSVMAQYGPTLTSGKAERNTSREAIWFSGLLATTSFRWSVPFRT